jgi:hypothetical protein
LPICAQPRDPRPVPAADSRSRGATRTTRSAWCRADPATAPAHPLPAKPLGYWCAVPAIRQPRRLNQPPHLRIRPQLGWPLQQPEQLGSQRRLLTLAVAAAAAATDADAVRKRPRRRLGGRGLVSSKQTNKNTCTAPRSPPAPANFPKSPPPTQMLSVGLGASSAVFRSRACR